MERILLINTAHTRNNTMMFPHILVFDLDLGHLDLVDLDLGHLDLGGIDLGSIDLGGTDPGDS